MNDEAKPNLKQLTELSFRIIAHAGEAKSKAMEAIYAAKESNFHEAETKLNDAEKSLVEAEKQHFDLIRDEAQGKTIQIPLILMHAEDQMLTTQIVILLGREIIELRKEVAEKSTT